MSKKIYNKKAQEEMVGFALIIIIVAIILLFLLVFTLRGNQKSSIESYEADSFVQSVLQVTSDCESGNEFLSVQDLIFQCNTSQLCEDGKTACEALNSTLEAVTNTGWPYGPERPIKGYEISISVGEKSLISMDKGEITNNFKSSNQPLPGDISFSFKAYF